MKTIVKMLSFNDGCEKEFHNGDWLYVETYPRIETVIAAFLGDGYQLRSCSQHLSPAEQKEGYWANMQGNMGHIASQKAVQLCWKSKTRILIPILLVNVTGILSVSQEST